MNNRFYLFLAILFLIVACDNDNEKINKKAVPSIEIEAYYEVSGKQMPLINAHVYVYNRIAPINLVGYTYDGKGNYTKEDHIISPDQILSTDAQGRVIIYPQDPHFPISIFVENSIWNMLSHSYWPYCQEKIKEKIIFTN